MGSDGVRQRFPPSPFRQIGPVKIFLRRVAQLGMSGALKDTAQPEVVAKGRAWLLDMVALSASWLVEVWDLEQLEEVRPPGFTVDTFWNLQSPEQNLAFEFPAQRPS